jgi:hypothetical protein
MTDLQNIPITESTKLVSFDIANMYTNIPTDEIPNIVSEICTNSAILEQIRTEILLLTQTVLGQNYFQFQNQIYKQTTGLAMGAPTSSAFSEIYLQYIEHNVLYGILQNHNVIGYFYYVDDILLFFDKTVTNITQVLNEFNTATATLKFTMEPETDNKINFLDITIKKEEDKFSFDIYRKPTCTDIIIAHDSCHPTEHKLSAISYLHNRNNTYLTDKESKQNEQTVINQILYNKYDPLLSTKYNRQKPPTHIHKQKSEKWAKFTFVGKVTRYITKLFKKQNINIAFTTNTNIIRLLQQHTEHDPYMENGVYQLNCLA